MKINRLNIVLLCVNIFLAVCYVVLWLRPSFLAAYCEIGGMKKMGMVPYISKYPFTVYVNQHYPDNKGFMIGVANTPVAFSYDDVGVGKYNAQINIGIYHAIGVLFQEKPSIQFVESMLINSNEYYLDVGAKGCYDKHTHLDITEEKVAERMGVGSNNSGEKKDLGI